MASWYGKRRNKYNNKKVEYNGIKFDSKKECERYQFLKALEDAGSLSKLTVHPRFQFILPSGRKVLIKGEKRNTCSSYTPDFSYYTKDGVFVVEDVKSPPTAKDGYFKLKRALFEALFEIDLKLVFKAKDPID